MRVLVSIGAMMMLLLQSTAAVAVADGPDRYRVRDVRADDSLNIRAEPNMKGKVIGTIPHDGRGIENRGDTMPPRVSEMSAPVWCKVRYQGVEGWVGCRYLGEDSAPTGCAICRMKIASVAVGMKATDALRALGAPQSKGAYRYNGACTDDYSATWRWSEKGMALVVTAADATGRDARVSEIVIDGASPIKLRGAIGIGSTAAEVKRVFGKYQTPETKGVTARTPHTFWIGRDCEAIAFHFTKGRVSRVAIGTTYCDC